MRKGTKIDEDIRYSGRDSNVDLLNSSEERYDVIRAVGHILFVFGLGLQVVASW
jgi:hypothetical protein